MDRAKKKLASAFDGILNPQGSSTIKADMQVKQVLKRNDFSLAKVVRQGFPYDPRCLAFDPVQRLLAIGTGQGCIRIIGAPGVDYHLKHESSSAVVHLQFLVNEGALISACKDDTIHLWNFRQKEPGIVHSLQMQKEQVTSVHLPFQSKWLYVGTDRGNVFVVSIESFTLSGYVINWNKAIDLSCRTHPGPVKHLSVCPTDQAKLLIGFEKGIVVLWNVTTREADRFVCEGQQSLRGVSWHFDGRQFVCALGDGSLCVWSTRKTTEPVQRWAPHSKDGGLASGGNAARSQNPTEEGKKTREKCKPITQVDWNHGKEGAEEVLVFTGGMPLDDAGHLPAITVLRGGRSATVLEMEHPVIAFCTLCGSPYSNGAADPYAVAVLLKNDFLIVDLTTPGYPCFENPYPMDIHESPVTVCEYFSDCPVDLFGALTLVGSKQRRQGFSEKNWPITGGTSRENAFSHMELVLTGHEDGSLKFWQASGENLQILYKLKTGRHFERASETALKDTHCHAVTHIQLCPDSRGLAVAGKLGQITYFQFSKTEASNEISVVDVPPFASSTGSAANGDEQSANCSGNKGELKRQGSFHGGSNCSQSSEASNDSGKNNVIFPLKVRGGPFKRPAGYQPELVTLLCWQSANCSERVTVLSLNTAYGLLAVGTEHGVALVDTVQHILVWQWTTSELYGAVGAFVRPKLKHYRFSNEATRSREETSPSGETPSGARQLEANNNLPPAPVSFREPLGGAANGSQPFDLLSTTELDKMFQLCSTIDQTTRGHYSVDVALNEERELGGDNEDEINDFRHLDLHVPPRSQAAPATPRAQKSFDVVASYRQDGAQTAPLPRRAKSTRSSAEGPASSSKRVRINDDSAVRLTRPHPPDELKLDKAGDGLASPPGTPVNTPLGERFDSPTLVGVSEAEQGAPPIPTFTEAEKTTWSVKKQKSIAKLSKRLLDKLESAAHQSHESTPSTPKSCSSDNPDITRSQSERHRHSPTTTRRPRVSDFVKRISSHRERKSKSPGGARLTSSHHSVSRDQSPRLRASSASKYGTVFVLKGQILATAMFDHRLCLLAPPTESWKSSTKANDTLPKNKVITKYSLLPDGDASNPTVEDQHQLQFVLIVAEYEMRVIGLPTHATFFLHKPEIPFVCAIATQMKSVPVLVALTGAGAVVAHSLPSLTPLLNANLLGGKSVDLDDNILRLFCLSDHGIGIYMCTPSEMEKFTVSADFAVQIADSLGELFVPVDMPEPPKPSFLKSVSNFVASKPEPVDHDELFTTCGKPSRNVARVIPGPSANMAAAQGQSVSAGQAAANALQRASQMKPNWREENAVRYLIYWKKWSKQTVPFPLVQLHERHEKLDQVVDVTEKLRNNAEAFSTRTGKLVEKMEKKKWYNF